MHINSADEVVLVKGVDVRAPIFQGLNISGVAGIGNRVMIDANRETILSGCRLDHVEIWVVEGCIRKAQGKMRFPVALLMIA